MDEQPNASPTTPPRWKRIILRAAVWGFSFGIGVGLVIVVLAVYTGRQKGWDTKSLRAMSAKAAGRGAVTEWDADGKPIEYDEKGAEIGRGGIITVDIQNSTGRDITLPASITIMQAKKGTGALHASFLKLSQDYLLPARHTVSVTLDADNLCSIWTVSDSPTPPPPVKFEDCLKVYFGDDTEIVLFDQAQKYEIHVAVPVFTP